MVNKLLRKEKVVVCLGSCTAYNFCIRDQSLFMWRGGGEKSWGGPGLFLLEKRGGPKENFTMIGGGSLCVL